MNNFYSNPLLSVLLLVAISMEIHAQPYESPSQADPAISFDTFSYKQHQIHYAYAGNENKPGLLFIHGTPGSWRAFGMYLRNKTLQKDYFMVSIDRPGWGQSILKAPSNKTRRKSRKSVKSSAFDLQAESIIEVMNLYPNKKWVLVGHSLGASIAPKVALIEAQADSASASGSSVQGMLLLAGSIDPKLGKPRWFNRAATIFFVRWMLPAQLRYSNDEIMDLRKELKDIESELITQQLTTRVIVMQGMKDKLVSPKNTGYAEQKWNNIFPDMSIMALPEAGHFLPWQQTDLVIDTIRSFEF